MAPMAKKGPKGTASFMSPRWRSITASPARVPVSEAVKMVNRTQGHPKKAPIKASSLMSPPPMPSRPVASW